MLPFFSFVALAEPTIPPVPPELTVAAAPKRETVLPAAPSYCGSGFEPLSSSYTGLGDLRGYFSLADIQAGTDTLDDRMWLDGSTVARLACTFPDDAAARAWVASYKQVLVNQTGVSAAYAERFLAAHVKAGRNGVLKEIEASRSTCGVEAPAYPDVRTKALAQGLREFVCDRRVSSSLGLEWWLDTTATSGQVDRALLLARFLSAAGDDGGDALVPWLFIRQDAMAYDPAAAAAALDAQLEEPFDLAAILKAHQLVARIEAVQQAWEGPKRDLPELAGVFTAADDGYRAWTVVQDAHPDGVAAVAQLEADWLGGRRSAYAGCDARLWPHFEAWIAERAPKDPDAFEAVVGEPYGWSLVAALARCEAGLDHPERAEILQSLLSYAVMGRGPRTAAVYAGLVAVAVAKADFERFPYQADGVELFTTNGRGVLTTGEEIMSVPVHPGSMTFRRGPIAKVVDEGNVWRVHFAKDLERVPVTTCTSTNRIAGLRPDGSVHYYQNCAQTGTRVGDFTPEPTAVDKRFAKGLKPGRYVELRGLSDTFYVYSSQARAGSSTYEASYGW